MKKYSILFALILIQGCSSSGGDNVSTTLPLATNADATGIWRGLLTEQDVGISVITGVIVGDQLRLISIDGNFVNVGTMSISDANFTATTIDYEIDGTVFATSELSGTIITQSTLSGTSISSTGAIGELYLLYDAVTDKGSSLAVTDGNWTATAGGTTVSIDSTGVLTGSDAPGCVYLGTASIIDPAVNIYNLSLSISSCGVYDGAYDGSIVTT